MKDIPKNADGTWPRICHHCFKAGHLRSKCPDLGRKLAAAAGSYYVEVCSQDWTWGGLGQRTCLRKTFQKIKKMKVHFLPERPWYALPSPGKIPLLLVNISENGDDFVLLDTLSLISIWMTGRKDFHCLGCLSHFFLMACLTSCIVLSAAEFCSCAPGIVTLTSAPMRASMFMTAAFDMFKPPFVTSVKGHPNSEKMCSISCATPAAVISDIAHSQQNLVAASMRTRIYLHPLDMRKGPARSPWTFSSGNRVVPTCRGRKPHFPTL